MDRIFLVLKSKKRKEKKRKEKKRKEKKRKEKKRKEKKRKERKKKEKEKYTIAFPSIIIMQFFIRTRSDRSK